MQGLLKLMLAVSLLAATGRAECNLFLPALLCEKDFPTPEQMGSAGLQSVIIESAEFGRRDGWVSLTGSTFKRKSSASSLRISNTNLEYIERGTFRNLQSLKSLDLSRNKLQKIEPDAFNGLTLDILKLSENPSLHLDEQTFRGANIKHLVLEGCGLAELDPRIVERAGVRLLSLANNNLSRLPASFAQLVSRDYNGHWGMLDVSANPLDCSCELSWLSAMLVEQEQAAARMRGKSLGGDLPDYRDMFTLNFQCATPQPLAGLKLPMSDDILCPPPKITQLHVDVTDVREGRARLVCTAQGLTAPTITWKPSSLATSVDYHRKMFRSDGQAYHESRASTNVSLAEAADVRCVAHLPEREKYSELDLKLRVEKPREIHDLAVTREPVVDAPLEVFHVRDPPPFSNLFVKQFTLVELLGAIFGTFVVTVLFLFLAVRCLPQVCFYIGLGNSNSACKKKLLRSCSQPFVDHDDSGLEKTTTSSTMPPLPRLPAHQPEYVYSSLEYDIPRQYDGTPKSTYQTNFFQQQQQQQAQPLTSPNITSSTLRSTILGRNMFSGMDPAVAASILVQNGMQNQHVPLMSPNLLAAAGLLSPQLMQQASTIPTTIGQQQQQQQQHPFQSRPMSMMNDGSESSSSELLLGTGNKKNDMTKQKSESPPKPRPTM